MAESSSNSNPIGGKRLVLCLDGTWNTPAQELEREDNTRVYRPTNVLKVARAVKLRADDGKLQVVYYDTGIGAMSQYPGATNGVLRWFDSKLVEVVIPGAEEPDKYVLLHGHLDSWDVGVGDNAVGALAINADIDFRF